MNATIMVSPFRLCRLFVLLATFGMAMYGNCVLANPPGVWVSIGPDAVPTFDQDSSGRASLISVNPMNKNDVWLGTATGGVWHTTNALDSDYDWEPMTDAFLSLAVGSILLKDCSVVRCNTVYVGTGENALRRDTYYGAGLLKLEWNPGTNVYDQAIVPGTVQFAGGNIIDLIETGGVLYAAVSLGKTASGSSATVDHPPPLSGYGVFRSNDDGATWTLAAPSPMPSPPESALPTDLKLLDNKIYAGFLGAGVFVLSAAGEWCPQGPGTTVPTSCTAPSSNSELPDPNIINFDHVELAEAPSVPGHLYAVVGHCPSETWFCEDSTSTLHPPTFYERRPGGDWFKLPPSEISTYSRYTHLLTVHPVLDELIYYGGVGLWISRLDAASGERKYYEAQRGCAHCMSKMHVDHHDLVFPDPSNLNIRLIANDGGIAKTTNSGATWSGINRGISSMQFYTLCADPNDSSSPLVGGLQDNGTLLYRYGQVWEVVYGGDGGSCIIDSSNPVFQAYFTAHEVDIVGANFSGQWDKTDITAGIDTTDAFLVTPRLKLHRATKAIYFGTNRVYRRENSLNAVFEPISPRFETIPQFSGIIDDIERGNAITALAIAPSDPSRIYVGMYSGEIWTTTQCGPCKLRGCWKKVGDNSLPLAPITSIDVHPTNSLQVYATYSGFGPTQKVIRTIDGGESWQFFGDGIDPQIPVNVIRIEPSAPNKLWIGTDRGVAFRDENAANGWEAYTPEQGMPNVPVYDFAFILRTDSTAERHTVYAATHGRSVFQLTQTNGLSLHPFYSYRQHVLQEFAVTGISFPSKKGEVTSCTMLLMDRQHNVMSHFNADISGAKIGVDDKGYLVTVGLGDSRRRWVQICRAGECLGEKGTEVEYVQLQCGLRNGAVSIKPALETTDPPSTFITLVPRKPQSGRIKISAIAVGTNGSTPLASRTVSINKEDSSDVIGEKLRIAFDAKNGEGSVVGVLLRADRKGEDEAQPYARFGLRSKETKALQIMTAIELPPGLASGIMLHLDSIGLAIPSQAIPVQQRITTLKDGSRGGRIILKRYSPLGICESSIQLPPKKNATEIANMIYRVSMSKTEQGEGGCSYRTNTQDLVLQGDSIVMGLQRGLSVMIEDDGVGVIVEPAL